MNRKKGTGCRSNCPINMAVEILGDAWTLLILRDLMLAGKKAYNEFLASPEGIATNVLADRLQRLKEHGMIEVAPDPEDRRRRQYRLSRKGIDLAPVMVELIVWSGTHHDTAASQEMLEGLRQNRDGFLHGVRQRWMAGRS